MTSVVTAASTLLPWSAALEKKFTCYDRFSGEPVKVFRVSADGLTIEVPRGAQPLGLDQRDPGVAINFTSTFQPQKPDQLPVIEKTVSWLQDPYQHGGAIVCAPTGWGKTYVGSEICGRLGRRFCVVTTKEDIVPQWQAAIKQTLCLSDDEVGVWRGDHTPKPSHKAVVALVQSVMKGPDRYGTDAYLGFGTVLCDEVHRMGAESFSQTMWHFPSQYRIGMSATPERKDGRDLVFRWHIGFKVIEATQDVLVPKILVHRTGWRIPRTSKGDLIPHDFGNIMPLMKPMTRNPQRNALILQYLVSTLEAGRSTIAFSEVTEHLELIRDLLLARSIPEESIGFYVGTPSDLYGGTPKEQKVKREKQKVRPILLATYRMASEATNLPWLDTCLMMSPRADVVQVIGRIRREYEGKKEPVAIDLVDWDGLVLPEYANKRAKWYASIGATVKQYQ